MKRFCIVGVAALALVVAACGSSGNVEAHGSWTGGPASSASAQPSRTGDSSAPPAATKPSTAPTSVPAAPQLTIKVTGTCSTNGGEGMRLESSGFTPGGTYQTSVTYPNWKEYTYLADGGLGVADSEGHASKWRWNCTVSRDTGQRDPVGVYHLTIRDLTTHQAASTDFTVSYDN